MSNIEENGLSCIELPSAHPSTHSVIWLHGLGADGGDFVPLVPELKLPSDLGIRFVFPHAPIMPVTINNGYKMRAWYDISSQALAGVIDQAGIDQSVARVSQIIQKEVEKGIPTHNIILAGFSQGAVMALVTGLRYPHRLGGIIAISGYLPFTPQTLAQQASPANQQTPIFIGHGTQDIIVPYVLGKAAYALLHDAHYPVSWHSYPVAHTVCGPEIDDISRWLQATLHQ